MSESTVKKFERLPTNSKPVNYNLTLTPNLNDYTFKGEVFITVEILQATNSLVLNAAELQIQTAKFNDVSAEITYNYKEETIQLSFPSTLQVGSDGHLSLSFNGILNDRLKGFYRSTYCSAGKEIRCAVTQFAPIDARRCFPCWDEPELKATFNVTLIVETDLLALSNMPELSRTVVSNGLTAVEFHPTPIMSTYLLALVVGRFDFVEDSDADNVRLRVYTPIGRREPGRFALEVAKKTLPFYKDFFGIGYPLPKLDLIAVPDFAFGAMENWGLVAYRETALLVDEENSSAATRERVAIIVGHELAHQWFGNLVTMKWWTDLWLNEGFATWIEYLCVDHCYPEFDIWTRFVKSDLSRALELDALDSSHPIEVDIGNPNEIDEIFDAISYSKGASIIRMLHEWLGVAAFRRGLSRYLARHKFGNATTEQLWEALAEASGQPVQNVMQDWTRRMGYPLLRVSASPVQDDDQSLELTVSQEKFSLGRPVDVDDCSSSSSSSGGDFCWRVPIRLLTASGHSQQLLLTDKTAKIRVPKSAWLKLNPGFVGFYRTLYSADLLRDLLAALGDGQLSQRDRFNLENDQFALASAGLTPLVQALELAKSFQSEQSFTVWSDLLSNLSKIQVVAECLGLVSQWNCFICQLCEPAFQQLGWEFRPGDSHDSVLLRALLIGWLGRAGCQPVVDEAKARLAAHCSGKAAIAADLRAGVYGTALANGGAAEFEAVLGLLDRTELQEEKMRIQCSLGNTQHPEMLQRVLQLAISGKVRLQDAIFVLGGTSGSSLQSRRATWQFVKSNWAWFIDKFGGQFLLGRLVQLVCNNFCATEDAEDIESFFQANSAPSAERNVRQAVENARLNARLLARDGPAVKDFLAKFAA